MSENVPTNDISQPMDPKRKAALERLRAQRAFWQYFAVWVIIGLLMTVLWLLTSRGYFWPIWVIVGMGIGLVFMGLNAYGPRNGPPTEDRIQQEMDKM